MALVAHYDLDLHQMGVKTAFLNENLNEEYYMDQPLGFIEKGKENMVCKLKDQYMDLNKIPDNGIFSSMILLFLLGLRKTLLIGVYI